MPAPRLDLAARPLTPFQAEDFAPEAECSVSDTLSLGLEQDQGRLALELGTPGWSYFRPNEVLSSLPALHADQAIAFHPSLRFLLRAQGGELETSARCVSTAELRGIAESPHASPRSPGTTRKRGRRSARGRPVPRGRPEPRGSADAALSGSSRSPGTTVSPRSPSNQRLCRTRRTAVVRSRVVTA